MALGDFDKSVILSENAKSDVQRWLDKIALEISHIDKGPFNMFPTTDVWISKAKFPAVFGEVFERTFIPSVIIESFRKCGIFA